MNLRGSSPEKVPEKTPGAWLTKLSMMAPGLRERGEGLEPLLGLLLLQLAWRTKKKKKKKTQSET